MANPNRTTLETNPNGPTDVQYIKQNNIQQKQSIQQRKNNKNRNHTNTQIRTHTRLLEIWIQIHSRPPQKLPSNERII